MTEPADRYAGAHVLVTGATGFIGAHLAAALAQAGARVEGVARRRPDTPLQGCTVLHTADLADLTQCRALIRSVQPDYIFHLASHVAGRQDLATVLETFTANLAASVNLFTAAAELGKPKSIVVAGSSEEPRQFTLADPETAPTSPYAAAKLGQSAYAAFFRRTLGLPISHARIFMCYGPAQRDSKKLVPYVTLSLLRGQSPALASGRRLADWTYVGDVVDGLVRLGQRPDVVSLEIGSGRLTSVGDIALKLRDIIDPAAKIAFGAEADRLHEPQRFADIAQSLALVGWRPEVGLDDGLRRTVDWYRAARDELNR